MIFNGIKISAAKKQIARLVEEQSLQSFSGPAKSLGIIVDAKNEYAIKVLTMLKNQLSISEENLSIFYYSQYRVKPFGLNAIVFNLQDFDNRALITNEELQKITGEGVDLLITFAGENNTVAHLLTANFKAGIKVGRFQQNAALYDLILQTEEDEELFVDELLKYLKNLKKGINE